MIVSKCIVASPAVLLLFFLAGCSGNTPSSSPGPETTPSLAEPVFSELAEAVGLRFVYDNGASGDYFFPEIMGAGGALFDYDQDGDLDVYLVQGHPLSAGEAQRAHVAGDRLFRNDLVTSPEGAPKLQFTDVTAQSGIEGKGYGMGTCSGDFNRDGLIDLFILDFGPNHLWQNNGDGTFSEKTTSAGISGNAWSVSGAFLDFDKDGWLDLFVCNYTDFTVANNKLCVQRIRDYCNPKLFQSVPDRLYRNRGDGTFEDVSERSGIRRTYGKGLGVVTADFNGDGWTDIYVANDGTPNQLWINRGDGRFEDTAPMAGCAFNLGGAAEASMGVDAADFDDDGDEDLFITHFENETNTLYINDGSGSFEDRTIPFRLAAPSTAFTGFGAAWLDFDNDSYLDILCVNGAVSVREAQALSGDPFPYHQPNQLFRNTGQQGFEEITGRAGTAFQLAEVSRGAMFGDIDNDGDTDVVICNNQGPVRLLVNQVGNRNHWLGLNLIPTSGDATGTRLTVDLEGGRILRRRVRSDYSYASANDPRVLIGLGAQPHIERVSVWWPDGSSEAWQNLTLDTWIPVRQGSGTSIE